MPPKSRKGAKKLATGQRNAALIAALESRLRLCEELHAAEADRHALAKREVELMNAIAAASAALQQLLAHAAEHDAAGRAAEEARAAGEAIQGQIDSLRRQLWWRCEGDGGGGGGAGDGGGGGDSRQGAGRLSCSVAASTDGGSGGGGGGSGSRQTAVKAAVGAGPRPRPAAAGAGCNGNGSGPGLPAGRGAPPPGGPAEDAAAGCAAGGAARGTGGDAAAAGSGEPRRSRADSSAGGGGGGAACSCSSCSAPRVSVATYFQGLVAARGLDPTRDEFVAWWRQRVTRLGVLLHQRATRPGAATREAAEEVNELWVSLATTISGMLLSGRPWVLELVHFNLETGAAARAPPQLWDGVADVLAFSPEQVETLLLLRRWWQSTMASLASRRQQLAQLALSAPQDIAVQEAALAGLERAQGGYIHSGAAANTVLFTALLTPLQSAEIWVQVYPWMPTLTAVLDCVNAHATGDSNKSSSGGGGGGGGGDNGSNGGGASAAAAEPAVPAAAQLPAGPLED
ncbi:hypothetical protein Rsub_00350 [Raphidocelis subcapitata]|uniref:Uncharacterized protein n=1 Tax=Raphidocelis subcapitata TaxID=307507 RepID=A0A2V0NKU0_9CHLO|nr:hypothetical protein Rsub_00350 [Raphidocelis subcapitata]|eukprot:GBF87639.1 hypothetical protein Rsub_00350 [Raphidocelis subcapitata]